MSTQYDPDPPCFWCGRYDCECGNPGPPDEYDEDYLVGLADRLIPVRTIRVRDGWL